MATFYIKLPDQGIPKVNLATCLAHIAVIRDELADCHSSETKIVEVDRINGEKHSIDMRVMLDILRRMVMIHEGFKPVGIEHIYGIYQRAIFSDEDEAYLRLKF